MENIIKASDLTVAQIQDGIIIYDPDTKDYDNNVIKWLVIGKNQDGNNTITIQSLSVIGDGAFGGGTGNRRYDKDPYKTDLSAEIQTWLDTDCFARFSYNFKEKTIPVTKEIVPYGIGGDVSSKECKLFNLSVAEVGGGDEMYDPEPNSFTYYYFQNINSSSANTKRVRTGNFNGDWHLRSPSKSEDPRGRNLHLKYVAADGSLGVNDPSFTAIGPAPGCVLSDEIWLEEDGEGDYLISYTAPKESYQKLYAYHEKRNGQYELKSYWTSSETVEFENGQTLEQYKPTLETKLNTKADEIDYSLDEGEVYLFGNGNKIATEEMELRVSPNIGLDDVSSLSIRLSNGKTRLIWRDPSDVIFSEFTLVEWAGTKIIRKKDSAPNDINDGTLILDSKVRDAYSSTPYYDDTITGGTYYYRFFAYDTDGNYYNRTCGVVYKPIVLTPIAIPSIEETYTYTDENITPTFVNYDSNTMTRSGATYAKNAGTYTTTFTPKEGYKWNDNTTTPKTVSWSIGKANGFVELDKTQVEVDDVERNINVHVINSSGDITVASNNVEIVTAIYNSDDISLGYVSNGSTTINVSIAESNNYFSTSAIINVLCTNVSIYGIKFARYGTGANTYLKRETTERLDSAVGAYARSEVKNRTGASSFDEFYPWSDIEVVEDSLVGEVVKIPKYYYKCYDDTDGIYIKISKKKLTGYSVSPGHADRGDGKGEREYIYVGRYLSNSNNDYKSISGTQINGNSETISSFRTNIHNLRNDVWLIDNATWWSYILLYLVEYGLHNYNSSSIASTTFGFQAGNICGVSGATLNGATDNMTFHTGCLNGETYKASNKAEDYGFRSSGSQYRYIENFGSTPCFIDGIYNIIDSNSMMNIYNIMNPLDSINEQTGTLTETRPCLSNYGVQDYTVSEDGYSLYPTATFYVHKDTKYGTFYGPRCDEFAVNNSVGKKVLVNKTSWWQLTGTSRAFVPETTTCTASRLMILP